ncbi:hypothetical protein QBC39DRAFT_50316 [Podospora conica]|nr:hypothetical protein QBC39DRAFT_50316 [Schizothecium conicum]
MSSCQPLPSIEKAAGAPANAASGWIADGDVVEHFVRRMHPTNDRSPQGCWSSRSVCPSWLSAMSRVRPGTDGVNFPHALPVVRAVTDIALDICVAQASTSPTFNARPRHGLELVMARHCFLPVMKRRSVNFVRSLETKKETQCHSGQSSQPSHPAVDWPTGPVALIAQNRLEWQATRSHTADITQAWRSPFQPFRNGFIVHHEFIEGRRKRHRQLGFWGPSEGQVPLRSGQVPPEPHGYIPPSALEAAHGLSPTEQRVLHRTRVIKPRTMFRGYLDTTPSSKEDIRKFAYCSSSVVVGTRKGYEVRMDATATACPTETARTDHRKQYFLGRQTATLTCHTGLQANFRCSFILLEISLSEYLRAPAKPAGPFPLHNRQQKVACSRAGMKPRRRQTFTASAAIQ